MMESIKEVYGQEKTNDNIKYSGHLFLRDDFRKYLKEKVKDRFFDTDGTNKLIEEFKSLDLDRTGFSDHNIKEILSVSEIPETWKIGETIAECFLEDKYDYIFFSDTGFKKNFNSSYTGADLVGVRLSEQSSQFAFGEVKTSSDKKAPPGVFYGDSGLEKQLWNLKTIKRKRDTLVRWIWNQAVNFSDDSDIRKSCNAAILRYHTNNKDVTIVGVLVRDTPPNEKDLKNKCVTLSSDIPEILDMEMIAIYSEINSENDNWSKIMIEGE